MDEKTEATLERDSDFLLRQFDIRGLLAALLVLCAIGLTMVRATYEISNHRAYVHVHNYGFQAVLVEFLYVALLDAVLLISAWLLLRGKTRHLRSTVNVASSSAPAPPAED
jgi:hypothetical protein